MGAMDYAGGATVHASSGLAAVAYALVLGKRRDYHENNNNPHNVSFVYIGLAFLWFGWFAFNAGSGLAADARAANSFVATHLAACVAAVVWVLIDWLYTRKWSVVGLCTGVVAGLATITPGSGFVSPSSALLFGLLGSIACNYAIRYKHKYGFDDALDVFTVHYVGGIVGLLLTGVFAERYIISLGSPPGTPLEDVQIGGWLDGHWMQVPIQLAMIAAVSGWSFVVTYIILLVINKIPYMQVRLHHEDERIGTDYAQMGERAYNYIQWEEEMRRVNSQMTSDQQSHHTVKKGGVLHSIRRLLMADNHTVVKGVPALIEEPVLDYGQPKEMGSLKAKIPTGNDVITTSSIASIHHLEEQQPPHPPPPAAVVENGEHHHSSRGSTIVHQSGSSSSSSSSNTPSADDNKEKAMRNS